MLTCPYTFPVPESCPRPPQPGKKAGPTSASMPPRCYLCGPCAGPARAAWGVSSVGSERHPDTVEVVGSSPIRLTSRMPRKRGCTLSTASFSAFRRNGLRNPKSLAMHRGATPGCVSACRFSVARATTAQQLEGLRKQSPGAVKLRGFLMSLGFPQLFQQLVAVFSCAISKTPLRLASFAFSGNEKNSLRNQEKKPSCQVSLKR